MRIAINGMGRIGRLLFKKIRRAGKYKIVAVNDIIPADNLAYLLKYDSIYGTFEEEVKYENGDLHVGGDEIPVFHEADPENIPWKDYNVDVVLECCGKFLDRHSAEKHLKAGAKKVLLSTTGKEDIPLKVFGFNQNGDVPGYDILSPGGCMTNCSTHIIYLLNTFGIVSGMINILHSFTSRQALVDTAHNQFRRGRAASESIIPVDIDLVVALERLFPSLKDKLYTSSTRVPVPNGAYANFFVNLKSEVSETVVKNLFRNTATTEYKNIVQYTEEPLVSLDIKGNAHSCIVDGTEIKVRGKMVRVSAWFDNEYGLTSRMLDWLDYWFKE